MPSEFGVVILSLLSICTYEISPGRGSMCASSTSEAVVRDFSGLVLVLPLFKPVSSASNTELPAISDFHLSCFFTCCRATGRVEPLRSSIANHRAPVRVSGIAIMLQFYLACAGLGSIFLLCWCCICAWNPVAWFQAPRGNESEV